MQPTMGENIWHKCVYWICIVTLFPCHSLTIECNPFLHSAPVVLRIMSNLEGRESLWEDISEPSHVRDSSTCTVWYGGGPGRSPSDSEELNVCALGTNGRESQGMPEKTWEPLCSLFSVLGVPWLPQGGDGLGSDLQWPVGPGLVLHPGAHSTHFVLRLPR